MSHEFHNPAIAHYRRTQPNHMATVQDIEDAISGRIKAPVRVVSVTNQAGTYTAGNKRFEYGANGELVVDGVLLAVGNRLLLTGQNTATENGVYIVIDAGSISAPAILERAEGFNDSAKILDGVRINVDAGTQFANTTWRLSVGGTIILDTTALVFIKATASQGASKFTGDIDGDNIKTAFIVKHDLGTEDVSVTVRNTTTGNLVIVDWSPVDGDNIELNFAIAPSNTTSFRVIVIG